MKLNTIVLEHMTKDRVAHIRKQAEIRGIDLKSDNGNTRFELCVVHYTFDAKAEIVTLDIDAPFDVTDEQVRARLDDLLGEGHIPEWTPNGKGISTVEKNDPVTVKDPAQVEDQAAQPSGGPILPHNEAQSYLS